MSKTIMQGIEIKDLIKYSAVKKYKKKSAQNLLESSV